MERGRRVIDICGIGVQVKDVQVIDVQELIN